VIDSKFNTLATQSPPNDGVLNTVGPLGVNVNALTGFDITADNKAFASFDVGPAGSRLYSINLDTGAATLIGNIGQYVVVRDIALMPAGRSRSATLASALLAEKSPTLPLTFGPPQVGHGFSFGASPASEASHTRPNQIEWPGRPMANLIPSSWKDVTAVGAIDQVFTDLMV
jgi:hypothetical protein